VTRRERLERKAERRAEWAGKARTRSEQRFGAARQLADAIPLGQPILVGHHSEGRARRDQARIQSNMTRGVEEMKLAEHHEQRAAGLEDALARSMFSDDHDAAAALLHRLAERETEVERCVELNRAIRKAVKAGLPQGWLAATGATLDEQRAIARNAEFSHDHSPVFPAYHMSNLRNRIRADRERLKDVQTRAERAAAADDAPGGVSIERGLTGGYCRVTFADVPARTLRDELKAAGFWFARGSWTGIEAQLPQSVGPRTPDDNVTNTGGL
jgi:hypothetical protein